MAEQRAGRLEGRKTTHEIGSRHGRDGHKPERPVQELGEFGLTRSPPSPFLSVREGQAACIPCCCFCCRFCCFPIPCKSSSHSHIREGSKVKITLKGILLQNIQVQNVGGVGHYAAGPKMVSGQIREASYCACVRNTHIQIQTSNVYFPCSPSLREADSMCPRHPRPLFQHCVTDNNW